MTESMLTTRLSSVITGCGGNETTCSRRSSSGRTRATNGTQSASPGESARDHRRGQGGERDRTEEEESRCEDLAKREEHGDDGPDDPGGHARQITPRDRRRGVS